MSEHSHEDRVRLKAYEIWLNEGRPEGRDARHWEMAREAVGYEDARLSTLQPELPTPGVNEIPSDMPAAGRVKPAAGRKVA